MALSSMCVIVISKNGFVIKELDFGHLACLFILFVIIISLLLFWFFLILFFPKVLLQANG